MIFINGCHLEYLSFDIAFLGVVRLRDNAHYISNAHMHPPQFLSSTSATTSMTFLDDASSFWGDRFVLGESFRFRGFPIPP